VTKGTHTAKSRTSRRLIRYTVFVLSDMINPQCLGKQYAFCGVLYF